MGDEVPFVEWSGELLLPASLSDLVAEAQGNRVLIARVEVGGNRPETG